MRCALILLLLVTAACSKTKEPQRDAAQAAQPVEPAELPPLTAAATSSASSAPQHAPPSNQPQFVPASAVEGNVDWVRTLKREKTFRLINVPATDAGGVPLDLSWRQLPERQLKAVSPDQDYPANHVSTLELSLAQGAFHERIGLGDHSGKPWVNAVSYCRALKYRTSEGFSWLIPSLPNVVSSYSVGTPMGSTDYLLVRGALPGQGGVMYLLHRMTHDGECPKTVVQGPLSTCSDQLWQSVAEIRVASGTTFRETLVQIDVPNEPPGRYDCKEGLYGEDLQDP